MAGKPTVRANWAVNTVNNGSGSTPNKVQPSVSKRDDGFTFPEKPTRGNFNWLLNKIHEWTVFLLEPVYVLTNTGTTAVSGDRIIPNNSAADCTINLPATPAAGDVVHFQQGLTTPYSTFKLIVGRNGSTLMNGTDDMDVTDDDLEFKMHYNGSTWVVIRTELVGRLL